MTSRILIATILLVSTSVIPAQVATPPALDTALQTATVGSVLTTGLPALPNSLILNLANPIPGGGGALLYSDCPETVLGFGKLYSDVLPAGNNRVYLYHVNGMGGNISVRFPTVVTNEGTTTATMTLTRRSMPAPTANYTNSGRLGGRMYYESSALNIVQEIPPGGNALLDDPLDQTFVARNQLMNSLFDVTFSQPLRVTVLAVGPSAITLNEFTALPLAANDEFLRQGTFLAQNTRTNATPLSYKTSDGVKRIRVADGPSINADPPITGHDAEQSNADVTLKGNFAVTYNARVNIRSDNGKRVALLLNPRAGAYGGYFKVKFPEDSGTVTGSLIPSAVQSVTDNTQAAVIALLTPTTSNQVATVEFIPAGAMSLPFEILLVPYSAPPTPTPTASATETATPTAEPTSTTLPTASPVTPSVTPTSEPTLSPSPSAVPTQSASAQTTFKLN